MVTLPEFRTNSACPFLHRSAIMSQSKQKALFCVGPCRHSETSLLRVIARSLNFQAGHKQLDAILITKARQTTQFNFPTPHMSWVFLRSQRIPLQAARETVQKRSSKKPGKRQELAADPMDSVPDQAIATSTKEIAVEHRHTLLLCIILLIEPKSVN